MTTDTKPTDAEIWQMWMPMVRRIGVADPVEFARAVLDKLGTPPAVAPWRSAVLDLIDECPGLTMEQDRWLSRRVKELDFASTPQPTQPAPAAQGDALDTMRLDWLSADESKCVFQLGKSWYTRPSYGMPYRKRASLREAIDAARAAQKGGA